MTNATSYKAIFTNGEGRVFLAHSPSAARAAAYSWMCAYRDERVFIKSIEEVGA